MSKKSFKPERVVWMDLEMTGLDPKGDLILEVAVIVTDWKFNEIATYTGIIRHEEKALMEGLARNGAFWDANPAARDGLIKQNATGVAITRVERELIALIDEHCGSGPALLAGNSIHMDRRFIEQQWTYLEGRLHYRMLDVTAWKVVFESKYGKVFAKPEEHRALEDIRGSIMELQYYLGKITP